MKTVRSLQKGHLMVLLSIVGTSIVERHCGRDLWMSPLSPGSGV